MPFAMNEKNVCTTQHDDVATKCPVRKKQAHLPKNMLILSGNLF